MLGEFQILLYLNLNNYMRLMATVLASPFPFQVNTDVLLHFLFPSPFFLNSYKDYDALCSNLVLMSPTVTSS